MVDFTGTLYLDQDVPPACFRHRTEFSDTIEMSSFEPMIGVNMFGMCIYIELTVVDKSDQNYVQLLSQLHLALVEKPKRVQELAVQQYDRAITYFVSEEETRKIVCFCRTVNNPQTMAKNF